MVCGSRWYCQAVVCGVVAVVVAGVDFCGTF